MYKAIFPISLLVLLASLLSNTGGTSAKPPPPSQADRIYQVEQAIFHEIETSQEEVPAYLFYITRLEDTQISDDGNWAVTSLVPIDTQMGYPIPAEPALALAKWGGEEWEVYLPHHRQWSLLLQSVPPDLLPKEDKKTWLEMYQRNLATAILGPFTGYKLPWPAGNSLVLTRSITHHSPPDPNGSMHYAFDFAAWHDASGKSPMFPILASKSGRVRYARWHQENGSESSPGNYLVLEDTSTNPFTYQLYLHLAKDSIPEPLRIAGAPVVQGQFIGMADDTGYSTGNHLHFQVHTNPSSYWGSSVDITFEDVAINAGRPRTPIEAQNYPQFGSQGMWEYVSSNTPVEDLSPPTGTLNSPDNGIEVLSNTIMINGSATDNEGIASIRIKANYSDTWHYIGPIFSTSPFEFTWDLCQPQVPDGPISLALEIQDIIGNIAPGLPGLRHLIKNYTCPSTPACIPNADQIALFAGTDYSGACSVFDISDTGFASSALGSVGDNNAESIKVGDLVIATLFSQDNFRGRGETFVGDDSNLSDNLIGANRVSSLFVHSRNVQPFMPSPLYPPDNASFIANDIISLSWENLGGTTQFRLKLNNQERDWQTQPFLHLDSLNPGTYTWQVQGGNQNGYSQWSTQRSFTITNTITKAMSVLSQFTAPFTDTMENGYNGWFPGAWDQNLADNHTPDGHTSWRYEVTPSGDDYDTGLPNAGYLTSPPIVIPTSGFALRFWYLYETESTSSLWDQRWVQISDNGGPFRNILQLFDDPQNVWLPSPPIDLSPYAGHTIQIRFYFVTLDANENKHKGWYIDDFVINTYSQPHCEETYEPDESPDIVRNLDVNIILSGQICPSGDVDYFRITGKAGDRVGIATRAQLLGSRLDTFISLLDSDFSSILAQNDDRYPNIQTDSWLSYQLSRDGIYYIKLHAWDHPSAGGSDYAYEIALFSKDNSDPSASILSPASNTILPGGTVPISISANDPSAPGEISSGISHIEFYWHSGDWQSSSWNLLGMDWIEADGWSYNWITRDLPDQSGLGIFARVYDWAGNWRDVAAWNLNLFRNNIFLPSISR